MDIAANFRVTANEGDITSVIADRLISLKFSDEMGFQSDMLEIHLADHDPDNPIVKPNKGAELELWLGYDDNLQRMGLFVADEIGISGWPKQMTIRARAAAYDKTPKGKLDLQTQKVRSWPDKTNLGDMVAKIAKEHGMESVVSQALSGIVLPHLSQTEESDISFLVRVTKQYDGVVKPSGGKLVVAKRGESRSASGEELPSVTFDATDCHSFHMVESARESPGTVVAYWHATLQGKRIEVKVGSGDPVKRLRHYYPTEDAATAAANGELDKRKRKQQELSISVPGNSGLQTECTLKLTGFDAAIDGDWLVRRVEHELDKSGGYRCHVDAEKPTDTPVEPDDA